MQLVVYVRKPGLPVVNLNYTATQADADAFVDAGSPSDPVRAVITVDASVWLYASSTSEYGLDTNGFAAGSEIQLECNGKIVGKGGNGGEAGSGPSDNGNNGGSGGPALRLGADITITGSGYIGGGGGGGGGGGNEWTGFSWTHGGGGGGGRCYSGTSGASAGGGSGSSTSAGSRGCNLGTCGGNGGDWGADGDDGQDGHQSLRGYGGSGGKAIELNSNSVTSNTCATYGDTS